MRKKYFYIIISLLTSLFIYLFYRTERTVVNEMILHIISFRTYAVLKENIVRFLPLNGITIYSLPEGLWVFCITLTSKPYYVQLNNWRIKCVFIPLIVCISLEIFQLLHLTNGRFDFNDIGMSAVFWLIANYAFSEQSDKCNMFSRLNSRTMVCLGTYSIVYLSHVL